MLDAMLCVWDVRLWYVSLFEACYAILYDDEIKGQDENLIHNTKRYRIQY